MLRTHSKVAREKAAIAFVCVLIHEYPLYLREHFRTFAMGKRRLQGHLAHETSPVPPGATLGPGASYSRVRGGRGFL